MATFNLEHVIASIEELDRYLVHADFDGVAHLRGMVDLRAESGALRVCKRDRDVVEAVWRNGQAVGHRIGVDRWIPVQGLPPRLILPPDARLLRLVARGDIEEEGPHWVMRLRDAAIPVRDADGRPVVEVGGLQTADVEYRRWMQWILQELEGQQVDLEVRVARENPPATRVAVYRNDDGRLLGRMSIVPTDMPPPEWPDADVTEMDPVSLATLSIDLPSIGGWTGREGHARWAQRALDLLEQTANHTGDERYRDLYDPHWAPERYDNAAVDSEPDGSRHHPLVVGAYYEDHTSAMPPCYDDWFKSDPDYAPDHYWKQQGYWRDYNHFGGGSVGLEHRWYFALRGCPPAGDLVAGRYCSARDWGFGAPRITPGLNRLTFADAIEQYNSYTYDGKLRAYLMLGHVVHLLQDQGQPDHARLIAHPGSSMDEVEAYATYHYCEFLALEAAAVAASACWGPWSFACAAVAFGIAEAACWGRASRKVVGYERLIGPPVEAIRHWELGMAEPAIHARGVLTRASYDEYFQAMADTSIAEAAKRNLSSALGCGPLLLVPPIPDADPAIDTSSATETAPYVELTKALVPEIVGLSAGLMRHFYDIVNHPPILERVTVVQWQPRAVPRDFGVLAVGVPDHCVRYDASWMRGPGQRTLNTAQNQHLSLDRPAYVFLLFGPTKPGQVPELGRRMRHVRLEVTGTDLSTGESFREHVPLALAQSDIGCYYWGSFQPRNCVPDPYQVTFEVQGQDDGAHLSGRPGAVLDSDPATLARAMPIDPTYAWVDYSPGTDHHHKMMIDAAFWQHEAEPQSLSLHRQVGAEGSYRLAIRQRHLDCEQEKEYWGLTRCPARWELRSYITADPAGTRHQPEELGLAVRLTGRGSLADVTVEVRDAGPRYKPGTYRLHVDHEVGAGNYVLTGTQDLHLYLRR